MLVCGFTVAAGPLSLQRAGHFVCHLDQAMEFLAQPCCPHEIRATKKWQGALAGVRRIARGRPLPTRLERDVHVGNSWRSTICKMPPWRKYSTSAAASILTIASKRVRDPSARRADTMTRCLG